MPDMTCPKCWKPTFIKRGKGYFDYACRNCTYILPDEPDTIITLEAANKVTKLTATIADLRERGDGLAKYSDHNDDCPAVNDFIEGPRCECGYDAALARWREVT